MRHQVRRSHALLAVLLLAALAVTSVGRFAVRSAQAAAPVTPNASPEAANVLNYLKSVETKYLLSGQSNYLGQPDQYSNYVHDVTGKYPAISGFELGPISGESAEQADQARQNVIDRAKAWWQDGGIVEIHWHSVYPGAPEYSWSNVNGGPFPENVVDKSLTPGTPEHAALLADLDQIAGYLGQLRDAHVPVLWRPYHEMNGGWFWWGQQARYAELWQLMYDRFVNQHQLNNLIWLWSPGAYDPRWTAPYSTYYPGDNYVDVVAIDSYDASFPTDDYTDLLPVAGDRPVGFSENGDVPDPEVIHSQQPRMSFFITWTKHIANADNTAPKNTPEWVQYVYNHPVVLTRDELPDLTVPIASPPPSSDGIPNGTYTLTSQASGKRLDVAGASTANGAKVWTWTPNTTCAQRWLIEAVGDGYYKLTNECSGKALDVVNASTADGALLQQWESYGGTNQQWRIEANSDGSYTLTARHSGKVLDVKYANNADGTPVWQWPANGTPAQRWSLDRLP